MKYTFKYLILVVFVITTYNNFAQETINAYDPNSFILGGDQKSVPATVNLLPVAIIDVEPDPFSANTGSGTVISAEAGLPVTSGAAADLDNIWLNFTQRSNNYQPSRIYVSTNQPVPAGMTIKVEIEIGNYGVEGDFPANPRYGQITLSQAEEIIVYDFASGYTGDGVNNGYHLIYTIENPGSVSLPDGFEVQYRIK
ncbi:hypothetical protein [Lutibacter sp. B1]|uniref:hypothetical protein n=1 Tax=Lutibacter sp. B1 TaxID=2725996 RepID=UPI001456EBED|nr:hypothetical protein [Lutibacter sp. B1]NLP59191.1 hypothetical protein [Lutibacter sp. B1]